MGCLFAIVGALIGVVLVPAIDLLVNPGDYYDGIGMAAVIFVCAPMGALGGAILGAIFGVVFGDKLFPKGPGEE